MIRPGCILAVELQPTGSTGGVPSLTDNSLGGLTGFGGGARNNFNGNGNRAQIGNGGGSVSTRNNNRNNNNQAQAGYGAPQGPLSNYGSG